MAKQKGPIHKFVEDRLVVGRDLRFGHLEFAKALKDIIKKSPAPFTIGLYGRWGSGKSTITQNLKLLLKPDHVALIIFDVWKHEGDGLRRTFLKELVEQLKGQFYGEEYFPTNYEPNEQITGSIEEETIITEIKLFSRIKWLWSKVRPFIASFAIASLLFGIVVYLFFNWLNLNYPYISVTVSLIKTELLTPIWTIFKYTFTFLLSAGFIALFLDKVLDISSKSTSSYSQRTFKDKYQDPHEFEAEFTKILSHYRKNRIVIAFDNVDRVSGKKAVNIISTIKTFLEPIDQSSSNNEVVFLIPCDVQAVKSHLIHHQNTVSSTTTPVDHGYADEFLRKFFNTIIWIPAFFPMELEQYALETLNQTHIPRFKNNDRLAWLITKAFRDNPRQTIQFVNLLVANYTLFEHYESKSLLPDNFLKNNYLSLAKYLVLQHKFPDIMTRIRELQDYALKEIYTDDQVESPFQETLVHFKQFNDETPHIGLTHLSIFMTLRKSQFEREYPGIDELLKNLRDRNIDDAITLSRRLEIDSNISRFCVIIQEELNRVRNQVTLSSIIHTLLNITANYDISFTDILVREIQNTLVKINIEFHTIDPELLDREYLNKYKSLTPTDQAKIVNRFASAFMDYLTQEEDRLQLTTQYYDSLFQVLLNYHNLIEQRFQSNIKQYIHRKYTNSSDLIHRLLSDADLQKKFWNADFANSLINSLNVNGLDSEKTASNLHLLLSVHPGEFKVDNAKKFFDKFKELMKDSETLRPALLERIADLTYKVLNKFSKSFVQLDDPSAKTQFQNQVNKIYAKDQINWFKVIFTFRSLGEPFVSYANSKISEFLMTVSFTNLIRAIESTDLRLPTFYKIEHNSELIDKRVIEQQDFAKEIYSHDQSTDNMKIHWLKDLMEHKQYSTFWQIVSDEKDGVPGKKQLANAIFTKMNEGMDLAHIRNFYISFQEMKLKSTECNPKLYHIYLNKLLTELPPHNLNQITDILSRTSVLSKKEKTELINETLNGLSEDLVTNSQKIFTIISCLDNSIITITKFFQERRDKLVTQIIEKNATATYDSLIKDLSKSEAGELVSSIATYLNRRITAPNQKAANSYIGFITHYFASINNEQFKPAKTSLETLTAELLRPTRLSKVHSVALDFVKRIIQFGSTLSNELSNALQELIPAQPIDDNYRQNQDQARHLLKSLEDPKK